MKMFDAGKIRMIGLLYGEKTVTILALNCTYPAGIAPAWRRYMLISSSIVCVMDVNVAST